MFLSVMYWRVLSARGGGGESISICNSLWGRILMEERNTILHFEGVVCVSAS